MGMSRNLANEICKSLPDSDWSEPFGAGHDVWKLNGKIFAALGKDADGISIKTPDIDTATMLIEAGVATKAPYFHRSWAMIPFDVPKEELTHRIKRSYAIIRASFSKKVQASLPPFTE
jgi:predicted DNA-binding protein (MmcQ/YjbR family)